MRKIKVGIIGMGRAGGTMNPSELLKRSDRYEIVAAADWDESRRKNPPELLRNVPKIYASFDELLADPEVELVCIEVRNPDHTPFAIRAMEAGKYVSLDKPMTAGAKDIADLQAAAAKHPGLLFPRLNRRFEDFFIKTRQVIDSGLLGNVSMVKVHRCCAFCRRNDWMTMREFYGGLLTNWGPHIIDQGLRYLGAPVAEMWGNIQSLISIGDGDDQIKLVMRGTNGRVVDVEVCGMVTLPGREIEVWGSRGTLVYDPAVDKGHLIAKIVDPSIPYKELKAHRENPPAKYGNFDETLYFVEQKIDIPPVPRQIWDYIYDTVVNGAEFPIKLAEVVEVMQIIDKLYDAFEPDPAKAVR